MDPLGREAAGIVCAIAFSALLLQIWRTRQIPAPGRVVAALPPLATIVWGVTEAFELIPLSRQLPEALMLGAWAGLAGYVRARSSRRERAFWCLRVGAPIVFVLLAPWLLPGGAAFHYQLAAILLLPVVGLVDLELLVRGMSNEEFWQIKHGTIGIAGLLVFNLYVYATALLLQRLDTSLLTARLIITALAAPLLMLSFARLGGARRSLRLSPAGAFRSIVLLLAGIYLVAMSLAGYIVRDLGGSWGGMLQAVFVGGALLLLPVVLSSGSVRASLKVTIAKHFFHYRYDYHDEWLRFIRTVAPDQASGDLHIRVIHAIANIVEATGGGLWLRSDEDRAFLPAGHVNFGAADMLTALPIDSPFVKFLEQTGWVVDLDALRAGSPTYRGLERPEFVARLRRPWVVVPLISRETLGGFVVLSDPRVRRRLAWEDFDILKTVGHHAAGYLAEERNLNALSDARRLEAFNRRFAFIIHDIKNVVSQMSLMLQNAERFAGNPDFQRDLLSTVAHSVDRLSNLLQQIKASAAPGEGGSVPSPQPAPLAPVLEGVIARWQLHHAGFHDDCAGIGGIEVTVPPDQLSMVLDHLLQNAAEAAGPDGRIVLFARSGELGAVISVEDDGPGMTNDEVQTRLFRPLVSDKPGGFGLGAFQCREMVRAWGGRLEVSSRKGSGTSIRVIIPASVSKGAPASGAIAAVRPLAG